jgi:hypothetical protein
MDAVRSFTRANDGKQKVEGASSDHSRVDQLGKGRLHERADAKGTLFEYEAYPAA